MSRGINGLGVIPTKGGRRKQKGRVEGRRQKTTVNQVKAFSGTKGSEGRANR